MSSNTKLPPPAPMAGKDKPVDWLFAFKFNSATFPGCTDDGVTPVVGSTGIFGGVVEPYKSGHSQQYVFATSANPTLTKGTECIGGTLEDPLGATFAQVYNNPGYFYVLWNDQFYNNPIENRDSPWGHSKGMVAWNEDGEGFVLQVSTPSWPASGSKDLPRKNDGNTLGCIHDDDIEVSQHFFALKLSKDDLATVLKALANASVATSVDQPSIVNNGGPSDIQALVNALGKESKSTEVMEATLSSGVKIIAKPSALAVPPWQMISAKLNGVNLRVASWWAEPCIYSTVAGQTPSCWGDGLGTPGAVQIATTGNWNGTVLGLQGGEGQNFNHSKIGISTDSKNPLCIFGDMNQQGALGPDYAYKGQKCNSSQNGRGGTFYVVNNASLFQSLTSLLKGDSAPVKNNDGSPAGGSSVAAASVSAKPADEKKKEVKSVKADKKKEAPKKKETRKSAPKKKAAKKAVKKKEVKKSAKKAAPKKKVAKKKAAPKKKAAKKKAAPKKKAAVKRKPVKKAAAKRKPVKKAAVKRKPVKKVVAKKKAVKRKPAAKSKKKKSRR